MRPILFLILAVFQFWLIGQWLRVEETQLLPVGLTLFYLTTAPLHFGLRTQQQYFFGLTSLSSFVVVLGCALYAAFYGTHPDSGEGLNRLPVFLALISPTALAFLLSRWQTEDD